MVIYSTLFVNHVPDHLRYGMVLIYGSYDCSRVFLGGGVEYLIDEPLPYGLYLSEIQNESRNSSKPKQARVRGYLSIQHLP